MLSKEVPKVKTPPEQGSKPRGSRQENQLDFMNLLVREELGHNNQTHESN